MSAQRLAAELGAELPAGVAALPAAELAVLADLVRDARRTQAADLARATDEGLRFLPRLLRGPVKAVLLR
ncbi:hypothetical protein [Nocardioides litoris]|uniref:hypothetical protein n=1 Tax=Nocardioides litoris TaxID=1926648 RepID=UPI00111CE434|nr:hypothetical protein [Nocardioides litoris]